MFEVTAGRGFYLEFSNGWGISVKFSPHHDCSNHGQSGQPDEDGCYTSRTAEVAVLKPNGDGMLRLQSNSYALGWQTPEDLIKLMNQVIDGTLEEYQEQVA